MGTPMFTTASFIIVKTWKQPKYSLVDEWTNKMQYIHTIDHYSALRRKEILTCNIDKAEDIMLSQTLKNKYHKIPLI